MYLGALLILLGAGLFVGSAAICLLGLAFLALMHLFVIVYEEPALSRRFGASYAAYRRSVARWLPGRPYTP